MIKDMTRKFTDTVFYGGNTFKLAAWVGEGLFSHLVATGGLKFGPALGSPHVNRINEYEVVERQFYLTGLEGICPIFYQQLPDFKGAPAGLIRNSTWFRYESLQVPVNFNGGLLIVRNELSEMAGICNHEVWTHSDVHELLFENGVLVEAHCKNAEVSKLRRLILLETELVQINSQIRDCFFHDYRGLRPLNLKIIKPLPGQAD